jgi:DNA-binding PadR family transcriptional regulator
MGNPFATETELLILRVLSGELAGMYGLEIVKASDGALSRGSVYALLGRMQVKGLVRSRAQRNANHPGLPRPRYKLTGLGEEVLAFAEKSGVVALGYRHG